MLLAGPSLHPPCRLSTPVRAPRRVGARRAAAFTGGRGVVLPELMIVVALVLAVVTLAVPAFNQWLLRDRADQLTRSLLSSLTFARNEALRLGARVELCRDDGAARCAKNTLPCGMGAAARADNWACGWLVMSVAGDARPARLLRIFAGHPGFAVVSPAPLLAFTPPAGQVLGNFRSFEVLPLGLPSATERGRLTRCIRLAAAGRPRLSEGPCAATR